MPGRVVDYSEISSRPGVADSAELGWRISWALQYDTKKDDGEYFAKVLLDPDGGE